MNPFLATQADDPLNPTPMLIQADWLEECGDAVGAAVLRALAESGTPSLHGVALGAAVCSAAEMPDTYWYNHADGSGDGDGVGGPVWLGLVGGYGDGCVRVTVGANGGAAGTDIGPRDDCEDNDEAFFFDV